MQLTILSQNLGEKRGKLGKLGATGANLGGIGANWETKVTKYGIIWSDSRGAAPLRRAERSLNTNPLGPCG